MAEITECNFRTGIEKVLCYKKLEVWSDGSHYGKCDGEPNCMEFQRYSLLNKIYIEMRKP